MQAPETPSTFPALFASVVIARGEHPALVTPDETLSYAELERRTARMARALLASRSEEHTSELQSLMRISYAVFCLKKKKTNIINRTPNKYQQSRSNNTKYTT